MDKYIETIKRVPLFRYIKENEISAMLTCLNAKIIPLVKNEFVLRAGDEVKHLGLVLTGSLHVIREDAEGNKLLIAALSTGDFFAEALCCANITSSPFGVVSDSESEVMLLEYGRILQTCSNSCIFHSRLIENMIFAIAEKNIGLQNRIEIISQKTTRLKVLKFLESQRDKQGRNLTIPFSREQLADFLCVDRSALSHELSRMKKDGLIDYHKNNFRLI